MAQDSEPSVEEILESIKKVINRDSREAAHQSRRRPLVSAHEERADPGDQARVLDLAEMDIADDAQAESGADDEGRPCKDRDFEETEDTPLIAEAVRGAMEENLAALAMLAEPGAKPQIVRSGETSLEGLTRELLRPMLARWLDENLPGMVEKLVQAEIARIAGKRR